jgi:hypothetical protein
VTGQKLRPAVKKTFIKGIIAIGIFSLFLEINPSTFGNYLVYLALSVGLLAAYAFTKQRTVFEFGEEGLEVRRLLRKPKYIWYSDVTDIVISQGTLAKRFNCGSVYLVLKRGKGNARLMTGGTAERLEDVPDPDGVFEVVSSRLSPFAQTP